ncbi:unnamed protein product, partial [Tetraodon nigroviridis]
ELTAIKARVQELEMEEETERLKEDERCEAGELQLMTCSPRPGPFYNMTPEERIDADNRSVYVGNVDYGATADELEIHFNGCGPVNRVTILCDRFSGHPKGFCPRGQICQASAPQTEGAIEAVTPEAEVVVSVLHDTRTVPEGDSGTSPPGLNIRRPTLTMGALRWGRDSGDM